jgi:hypothetical protein
MPLFSMPLDLKHKRSLWQAFTTKDLVSTTFKKDQKAMLPFDFIGISLGKKAFFRSFCFPVL